MIWFFIRFIVILIFLCINCTARNASQLEVHLLAPNHISKTSEQIEAAVDRKFVTGEKLFSRAFVRQQQNLSRRQTTIVFDYDQTIADNFILNPLIEPLLKELKKRNCRIIIWTIAASDVVLKKFFLKYPHLEEYFDLYILSNLDVQIGPALPDAVPFLRTAYRASVEDGSRSIPLEKIIKYYQKSPVIKNIALYRYHLIIDDNPSLLKNRKLSPTLVKSRGFQIPRFSIPKSEKEFFKENPGRDYDIYVNEYVKRYMLENADSFKRGVQSILESIEQIRKRKLRILRGITQKKSA